MEGGFRDWLAGLSRRELVLVGLLAAVALGGAGLWYVRSLPPPVAVRAARPPAEPTPTPSVLFVHVAGWVRSPGVYEVHEGDRVIDAIELAGGPKSKAQLSALNLAALLTDGQQILVPGPATSTTAPPGVGTAPEAGSTLVNVNTASAEELETLPGIGEVLAQAIIAYREEHGPFTSVDELDEVSGIGPVTLEEIRDLVTV